MNDDATPISLELFDRVQEYATSIVDGDVTSDSPLKQDTSIIVFCQNFFGQFFDNVLNHSITGFHQVAQREAVRLRRSHAGAKNAPTRKVIVEFEKFCELWSNLGAGGYASSRQEFLEFHQLYIPRLLQSILAWATHAELQEIAERSQRAADQYEAAAAHLGTGDV